MAAEAFEAMEAKNKKKSHLEVKFRDCSKVIEAIEAVVKVAEVVEATDLNIKRLCINESCLKRISQIRFFRERSPRLP